MKKTCQWLIWSRVCGRPATHVDPRTGDTFCAEHAARGVRVMPLQPIRLHAAGQVFKKFFAPLPLCAFALILLAIGGCRFLWTSHVLVIHGLESLPAKHAK